MFVSTQNPTINILVLPLLMVESLSKDTFQNCWVKGQVRFNFHN